MCIIGIFIPLFVKEINKLALLLFILFFTLVTLTLLKNPFQEFYYNEAGVNILKNPYLITISRFIEYVCCIIFVIYVYKNFRLWENRNIDANSVLRKILMINVWLSIFFIFIFILIKLGLVNSNFLKIYYNHDLRLRGFFDEGGPFGLMYAFLFGLSSFIKGKKRFIRLIFLITVILSQSKAGLLMIFTWVFYTWFTGLPNRYFIKPLIIIVLGILFLNIGYYVSKNYIDDIINIREEIAQRPNDSNLVMGRISGFFITPNMIYHNPILGVGMGNYSLVRNDPTYRGMFPAVDGWDLSGLGGIVTLIAESGLLGLLLFLLLLYWFYLKLRKVYKYADRLILLFLLPCIFGVQLYFLYIWFTIGLGTFYFTKSKTNL